MLINLDASFFFTQQQKRVQFGLEGFTNYFSLKSLNAGTTNLVKTE